MRPADILDIVELSDPRVAPDGRTIAFVATTPDLAANAYRSGVWVAGSTRGSRRARSRMATSGSARPAGRRTGSGSPTSPTLRTPAVDFGSRRSTATTVYELLEWPEDIDELVWTPDGDRLVFTDTRARRGAVRPGQGQAPVAAAHRPPVVPDRQHRLDDRPAEARARDRRRRFGGWPSDGAHVGAVPGRRPGGVARRSMGRVLERPHRGVGHRPQLAPLPRRRSTAAAASPSR